MYCLFIYDSYNSQWKIDHTNLVKTARQTLQSKIKLFWFSYKINEKYYAYYTYSVVIEYIQHIDSDDGPELKHQNYSRKRTDRN